MEEVRESLSEVLNEVDPFLLLPKPILKFNGCNPKGQPSSCSIKINQQSNISGVFPSIISNNLTKMPKYNILQCDEGTSLTSKF